MTGNGKGNLMWNMIKVYLASLVRLVAFRWLSPRQSQDDPHCAVGEVDLELGPNLVNYAGAFTLVLQKLDPRVNTDHPIFVYLGEAAERGTVAAVTVTISVRETPRERVQ